MDEHNRFLTFVAACIGMSFFGISMITLGSVLPALTTKLALSTLHASALVAFLPLGILIGSLVFGPICDHYGHRILFLLSCVAVLFGLTGLSFFHHIILLQLSIFMIGLGGGVLNGETNALVADLYDDQQRGSKLSLLGAFYGIGAIGMPLLIGFLSKYCDYGIIIRSIGGVMLACIIFCLFVRFPKPKQAQSFPFRKAFGLLKQKSLLLLSFILFFESGLEGSCNNWTALYLNKTTEINSGLILQTLTCMVVALTIARLVLVVLLEKVRQDKILISCFCIAMIGFMLLSVAQNFFVAAAGMIFVGVGISATYPVILNVIGKEYSALVGTAFGVAMTISIIGNTLINSMVGTLSSLWGMTAYPIIMMICILMMMILFRIHIINFKK